MGVEGKLDKFLSPEDTLKRENADLRSQAGIDARTGLSSSRFLESNLQKIIDEFGIGVYENKRSPSDTKEGVVVLFLDIDNFKLFNDIYGHDIGDNILSMVGAEIKNVLYRSSDAAYRYGGDELVVVLTLYKVLSIKQVEEVVEKKREKISKLSIEAKNKKTGKEDTVPITLSVGFAFLKRDDPVVSAKDLLKIADNSLYEDKKTKEARIAKAKAAIGENSMATG